VNLFIAASNGHVLAFDNVSGLAPWLSDALCRVASGGAFAVRQLFTDQEEVLFEAARPILVNGIEEIVVRPDLAERSIVLTLGPIADTRRRPERELWNGFAIARPAILGALLDMAVHGLGRRAHVALDGLPRMADFALWASACETCLWPSGTFTRAYGANRRSAVESALEADPVAAQVREIMAERSVWTGTASDLLRATAAAAEERTVRRVGWPANPRALAARLRRAQTDLRSLGIEISFTRERRAGTRTIRLEQVSAKATPS
jgi:hypothetical protein